MNWKILGISAVASMVLASCGGVGSGQTVDDPTTDQMNKLDQEWGLPARKAHSRGAFNAPADFQAAPAPEPPAAAQAAPAPQPTPPPLEPDPPRLDAGTIKKLQ